MKVQLKYIEIETNRGQASWTTLVYPDGNVIAAPSVRWFTRLGGLRKDIRIWYEDRFSRTVNWRQFGRQPNDEENNLYRDSPNYIIVVYETIWELDDDELALLILEFG